MGRITEAFAKAKKAGRRALIVYLTAGYPDMSTTAELAVELSERGVDIIELGIPFSDPIADGPVIQAASQSALSKGANIDKIMKMTANVRKQTSVPLVYMTYFNPVYSYGTEKFLSSCGACGIDGLIVPDLPPEESGGFKKSAARNNISQIFLLASNSPDNRIRTIAASSTGFIYCLSHIGITGTRTGTEKNLGSFIERVRRITDKPLAVGFGISTPRHVKIVNKFADGAIIGSAVVEEIKKNEGEKALVKKVGGFVESFLLPARF